jgi:hypothetical protein
MNINSLKHRVLLGMILISSSLSLPAAAQHHGSGGGHSGGGGHVGGGHVGGGGHGGVGWQGGHGGGYGWWGLGLGLGLGWEAAFIGNPYLDYPYTPPTVIFEPPSQPLAPQGTMVVAPPNSPPTSIWYYCDSFKSYYPYVTQCPEQWRMVPAVPPEPAR